MPLLKTHSEFINVDKLKENEIFVFGSNEAGIHGAGAAKLARKVGAKLGVGVGLSGNSYAIPTKDRNIVSLELNQIQEYVIDFLKFVEDNPQLEFLVTEIGCGLAGFSKQQIAPLFKNAINFQNISFSRDFQTIILIQSKMDIGFLRWFFFQTNKIINNEND